jgi:hypothetical protein
VSSNEAAIKLPPTNNIHPYMAPYPSTSFQPIQYLATAPGPPLPSHPSVHHHKPPLPPNSNPYPPNMPPLPAARFPTGNYYQPPLPNNYSHKNRSSSSNHYHHP